MADALVVRRPRSDLAGQVSRYCGYEHTADGPALEREPLSTGAVLILGLGPRLGIVDRRDPARPPARFHSLLAGLDDACAVIAHDGTMRGIQVDLTPIAARMIFRVPMHVLAREVVALEDVLGREAPLLEERLFESRGWSERFQIVEAALSAKLSEAQPPPPDVEFAWARLVATRGRLRVGDLAAELGCSRKHLAARFREHVGLPPKLAANMLQFRHACDLMAQRRELGLSEIALTCGYYDQPHLDRAFRRFAGTTPAAYRAERVTSVQDTDHHRA